MGTVIAQRADYGILAYNLLTPEDFCEECGRAKISRLMFDGVMSYDCATCKEVATRHRCTKRPALETVALGDSWECPDCGSLWAVIEEEDTCGECGRSGMVPGWSYQQGDRYDTAPRYEHKPMIPFRNVLPSYSPYVEYHRRRAELAARDAVPPGACYSMPSGALVHVKPGCRC